MCDTLIALSNSTADGSVLFAKNSDREPNEPHEVVILPAADYPPGTAVHCTYIDIPQVAHTYATLLARPVWIWGAEMGANEHGVVIGNEAVFTRVPYEKGPGLTGMDLLRLALERADSAHAALEIITGLLAVHGQGGNCGFAHPFYYHNSFLIGDPHEAWVLETAGREWAAERVRDVRSISNGITIRRDWDLASDGLVEYAVKRGWCRGRTDFDFRACYSDPIYTRAGGEGHRQACTAESLKKEKGQITVETMINTLRGHGPNARPGWAPDGSLLTTEVCMHASFGPIRIDQTTGSMVSQLFPGGQTHWVTGTAAPCTSLFKPVWIDAGMPASLGQPGRQYEPESLWWKHERLHREVLKDYPNRMASYRAERDALEGRFLRETQNCASEPASERRALTARCYEEGAAAEERWLRQVSGLPIAKRPSFLFRQAWKDFDRQAGIDLENRPE